MQISARKGSKITRKRASTKTKKTTENNTFKLVTTKLLGLFLDVLHDYFSHNNGNR